MPRAADSPRRASRNHVLPGPARFRHARPGGEEEAFSLPVVVAAVRVGAGVESAVSEPISPSEWLRAGVPKPGWAGEHVISRRTARRTTNPRQYSPLRWPRMLIIHSQYHRRRQRANIAVGPGPGRAAETELGPEAHHFATHGAAIHEPAAVLTSSMAEDSNNTLSIPSAQAAS